MKQVFEELVKKIRTKEELIFFLEEIARVRQIIFKDKEELLSKKAEGKASEELKNSLEKLEKEGVISKNPGQQSLVLGELEKYLLSFKEIKLEIAFPPNDDVIERISQWLEKELGQKAILNLIINPKIVGGAIIEYQGNWRDFSLAKEIDKSISQKTSSYGGV